MQFSLNKYSNKNFNMFILHSVIITPNALLVYTVIKTWVFFYHIEAAGYLDPYQHNTFY